MSREPIVTRPFVLAWAAHFAFATSACVLLHFPGYLREHGATEVEIGLVAATASFAALVVRPLVGPWIDRRGRAECLRVALLAHTLVCAGYFALTDMGPSVFVLRALHGVAQAASASVLFTLAAEAIPASRRTEGLAFFGISGMLPLGVGTLLGEGLLVASGYTALFAASTGLSLAGAALAFMVRAEPLPVAHTLPRSVFGLIGSPALASIWAASFGFTLANASLGTFLKTYVMSTGVGTIGHYWGVYSVVAVATRIVAGWVPDRVGPTRVLYPAALSTVAGFAVVAWSSSEASLVAAAVLGGIGHAFMFPILVGLLVGRTDPAERGTAMAAYTALSDLGALLGGPAFGAIIHTFGYSVAYIVAGSVFALGIAIFAGVERRRRLGTAVGTSSRDRAVAQNGLR